MGKDKVLLLTLFLGLLCCPGQAQMDAYNHAYKLANQAHELALAKDWMHACQKYKEALKHYPNYPAAKKAVAYCYVEWAKEIPAPSRVDWYKAALEFDPENKQARMRLELMGHKYNPAVSSPNPGSLPALSVSQTAASASVSPTSAKGANLPHGLPEAGSLEPASDLDSIPDQDRIPFTKDASGYMVVKAEINGRQTEMVFDTGANVCMIGADKLQSIGLDTKNLPGSTAYIQGATGSAIATRVLPLTLKIGKTSRKTAVYVPAKMPTHPLLGQNFLSGLEYEVNNQLQVLLLRKHKEPQAGQSGNSVYDPRDRNIVPFTMEGKNIVVPVEVCGKTVQMIFDTGADCVAFPAALWKQLNPPGAKLLGRSVSVGVDGARPSYKYLLERIDFGPVNLRDLTVIVIDPGPGRPLLGQKVLGGEKFFIDDSAHVIRFHR